MLDKKQIKEIHEKAIVFDAHTHPISRSMKSIENLDLGIDNPNSQIDFIKMKKGGVDAVFYPLPIFIDENEKASKVVMDSLKMIKEAIGKYSDLAEIAKSVEDLSKLKSRGKRAIFLSIEYFDVLEGNIDLLEVLKKSGVTSITTTDDMIKTKNGEGDLENAELTDFSKKIVNRMNELGIIIDITHLPDSLQKKVLNISSRPVIASHSNARGVCNISRNIPDDIIKLIAERGGAVMVTFNPKHISYEYQKAQTKAVEKYREMEKELKGKFGENEEELDSKLKDFWNKIQPETVNIEELIDHIDYIVKLVGPDYVGIGSDYSGSTSPKGLESATQYRNITAELLKRDYTEEDIIKILGGNLVKIMEKIQSK